MRECQQFSIEIFQSVRLENVLAVLDGVVLAGEAAEPVIEEACWRLVNNYSPSLKFPLPLQ